jgi:hypothetical protein
MNNIFSLGIVRKELFFDTLSENFSNINAIKIPTKRKARETKNLIKVIKERERKEKLEVLNGLKKDLSVQPFSNISFSNTYKSKPDLYFSDIFNNLVHEFAQFGIGEDYIKDKVIEKDINSNGEYSRCLKRYFILQEPKDKIEERLRYLLFEDFNSKQYDNYKKFLKIALDFNYKLDEWYPIKKLNVDTIWLLERIGYRKEEGRLKLALLD